MAITATLSESSSTTTTTSSTDSSSSSSDSLYDEFLTLLVAQLQNQDPTDPMDNSELVSQLAQISTLQGIEDLNTTLSSVSTQLDTSNTLQAASLVGSGVLIAGNSITVGDDGSTTAFGVELASDASNVTVTISDSSGTVVRTVSLGSQSAGVSAYTWDGTDSNGSTVDAGSYTFTVSATSSSGTSLTSTALSYATVYGVSTDDSTLNLGLAGTATLDDVKLII